MGLKNRFLFMKKIVIKAFITSFIALKFIVRSRNSIMSDILGKS